MQEKLVKLPTKRKRIDYFDAAKGLGMFLIIWDHASVLSNDVISVWGASFKVCLFFIISGMLVGMSDKKRKKSDTFKKLFKSLIIPYFIYSALSVAMHISGLLIMHKKNILSALWSDVFTTISFRGISALWFLPCIFIGRAIFELISYKDKKMPIKLLICLFTFGFVYLNTFIFGHFESSMNKYLLYPYITIMKGITAFLFICIGWLLVRIGKKYKKILFSLPSGIIMLTVNTGLCFVVVFNENVNFNSFHLGMFPIIYVIRAIIGSLGVIIILKAVTSRIRLRFLTYMGVNSLFFMATHNPLYITKATRKIVNRCLMNYNTLSVMYYIQLIIIVALILLIEFALCELVNKRRIILSKLKKQK